ncbi:hypothetical protein C8J56DRAFT_881482 [Mycena floridula]|nr:hypothetical protein C8J56DRAFT_881482 [Mycena floridula]
MQPSSVLALLSLAAVISAAPFDVARELNQRDLVDIDGRGVTASAALDSRDVELTRRGVFSSKAKKASRNREVKQSLDAKRGTSATLTSEEKSMQKKIDNGEEVPGVQVSRKKLMSEGLNILAVQLQAERDRMQRGSRS